MIYRERDVEGLSAKFPLSEVSISRPGLTLVDAPKAPEFLLTTTELAFLKAKAILKNFYESKDQFYYVPPFMMFEQDVKVAVKALVKKNIGYYSKSDGFTLPVSYIKNHG